MAKQSGGQKKTVERVMHEYKQGALKQGGGRRKVKNPKQAIAIALRYHAPLFVHESLFVQALEAAGGDSGKRI